MLRSDKLIKNEQKRHCLWITKITFWKRARLRFLDAARRLSLLNYFIRLNENMLWDDNAYLFGRFEIHKNLELLR